MKSSAEIVAKARTMGVALPAFNIAHLPMVAPVIRAVRDQRSFALVEVSRIDCLKFGARSMAAVAEEFRRHGDPKHVRLHLDHVPVIDEDGKRVDYRAVISEAIALGYESVMVDASRLPLDENIRVTREVADLERQVRMQSEAAKAQANPVLTPLGQAGKASDKAQPEVAFAAEPPALFDPVAANMTLVRGLG